MAHTPVSPPLHRRQKTRILTVLTSLLSQLLIMALGRPQFRGVGVWGEGEADGGAASLPGSHPSPALTSPLVRRGRN